jgi:DNA-binding NtrC family response regulator
MDSTQRTVLIADDDGDVRHRMQAILRERGYQVLTAETAESARWLLLRAHVDLLLIDRSMPGASELLDEKAASARLAEIPTVVVTIGAEELSAAGSAGAGVVYAPAP